MSTKVKELDLITEELTDRIIDLIEERMGKSEIDRQELRDGLRGLSIVQLKNFIVLQGWGQNVLANKVPDLESEKQDSAMAENWRWAWEARDSGALESYTGKHVVVANGRVVAANRDANIAVEEAVKLVGTPRRDLAVLYIDEPGAEGWFDVG